MIGLATFEVSRIRGRTGQRVDTQRDLWVCEQGQLNPFQCAEAALSGIVAWGPLPTECSGRKSLVHRS